MNTIGSALKMPMTHLALYTSPVGGQYDVGGPANQR
jgi:hypothetical protein